MSKSTEHDKQAQGNGVNSNVKFILKDKQPEQQTEQERLQQQKRRHRQMGVGSLSTHDSKSNNDVLEKGKVTEPALKNKVAQLEKQLEFDREGFEKMVQNLRKELEKTKIERDELEKKLELEKEKKEQALTRLSEVAGTKLTDNNAAIADLSDINRPQKLGEMFSEIYDNEWTDAYEELIVSKDLQSVGDDVKVKRISKTLLEILRDCDTHCTLHAGKLLSSLTDAVKKVGISNTSENTGDNLPGFSSKKIKDFRKSLGVDLIPCIREAYFKEKQQSTSAVSKYTIKCLQFCWYSALQDPAVHIDSILAEIDEQFDPNKYREFTKKGRLVDFHVWPMLYLHDGGALLAKGVVQCKDDDAVIKGNEQRDKKGTEIVCSSSVKNEMQVLSNLNASEITSKTNAFPANDTTRNTQGSHHSKIQNMTLSSTQSPNDPRIETSSKNVEEQEYAKTPNSTCNSNLNVIKKDKDFEGQNQNELTEALAKLKKVTPTTSESKEPGYVYVSKIDIKK